ncbi:hypothetical protein BZA05DRAFT_167272 [Tricharina praecox]|uniref:uncharacterized protein n=1 Tax=Tricharina praecox TaxID=43433 RepID=UPI0022212514|nr:uncharacterized protein BZA05DRAFT_167272 [Tricharina praecox]KAI5857144.1 hypothetical protein BZA05DRAFT_167272 [Tricharina praecox]
MLMLSLRDHVRSCRVILRPGLSELFAAQSNSERHTFFFSRMKSFIRSTTSTSTNPNAAATLALCRQHVRPLVLTFLAPAVYCNATAAAAAVATRAFSGKPATVVGAGAARKGGEEKLPPGPRWNKQELNRSGRKLVEGLRSRLESDVSRLRDFPDDEPKKATVADEGYVRRTDFTDDEVRQAHDHMRGVKTRHEEEDMALAALTQRNRRIPKYLYAVVPEALRAVERQIRSISDEIEMMRYHEDKMREQRRAVRQLLAGGRSVEAITQQYKTATKTVDAIPHFVMVMSYLIHYRRLFRLSSNVLEAMGKTLIPDPVDVGQAYHMLVSERLVPHVDCDRNKQHRKEMEKAAASCAELLMRILDVRANIKPLRIPQIVIHTVVQMAPVSMIANFYMKLLEGKIKVREFTGFHFVGRLARPDEETGISLWMDAFTILKSIQYRNGYLSSFQARHAIYGVLYQAMRANDPATTDEIMKFLKECGLEPGVEVYNMLMARAAQEADEVALRKYFDAITEYGFRPSMVSYAISHSFHKHQRNDREREAVISDALALDTSLNLFLATDILHAAVLQEKPYDEVYRRYRSFFTTKLLETFHIAPSRDVPGGTTGPKKLDPDHVTLVVMLSSYCKTERNIAKIWDLYKLYQTKLYDRTAPNRKLRKLLLQAGSHIPHTIMLGLGKRIQGLPYVAAVLEDMLKPHAAVESDVYSWSIFLNFLTRAGKMEEAETVVGIMRSRGLNPNAVTFTTLLNGYVRSNLAEQAEEVLDRMVEVGVETNVFTWTSLLAGYVKNGENWQAGDAFRRMLDASVQPDEVTLQAVSGITDRDAFEKGLSGELPPDLEGEEGGQAEVHGEEETDDWFGEEGKEGVVEKGEKETDDWRGGKGEEGVVEKPEL